MTHNLWEGKLYFNVYLASGFSLGDELGFPESLGNVEGGGGKKRSLDIRPGGDNVGVLPAVKMPVSKLNFQQAKKNFHVVYIIASNYPLQHLQCNYVTKTKEQRLFSSIIIDVNARLSSLNLNDTQRFTIRVVDGWRDINCHFKRRTVSVGQDFNRTWSPRYFASNLNDMTVWRISNFLIFHTFPYN